MPKLLNPEILDSFRELQSDDDPHFVENYFTALLDSLSQHLIELKKGISVKDFGKIATHAHAVKSSCANAGITQISDLAGQLEKLGNDQADQISVDMYDRIQRLCDQVRVEILALPEFKS